MKLSTIGRGLALGVCASLVLSACVAGSNAGQSGSSATGDADVTIGLTYIPNVQFAPVYVADAQGLYNDAGVTATVRHHGSDEGLFTALLAGQEDVVIASGDEAVVAASQGLDLVSIGQYYASYPGTVIVPADSPIATLADLKGKTIGIPGEYGSSYYATLAAIKAGGLQTSDVTISSIGYTQQAALAAGQVDAVVGFTNNDAVQMRLSGLDIREIPLDDGSTPLVAASIVTTREWAQSHPDAARAVVSATTEAMNAIAADPQVALDATAQWDTTLTDETSLGAANAVLAATVPLWLGDDARADGVQDLATWSSMVSFLSSIGVLEGDVDPSAIVTNEYADAGAQASSQS
ncbi:ABC transporter substrate-binding protein [uncultured Actinomyces sp.]|uniref:ABC transporter substrate-binding protein n=1 Tax=uncultured Actinomyces sp. TaxID=249061 RepID=UPI001CAA9545|nr:ABC transporter substrate-binding protein [uncultured Actinomyces sp.]MBF0958879.1 ABC transporter substrate-binding protein [Actinomyces sp.]